MSRQFTSLCPAKVIYGLFLVAIITLSSDSAFAQSDWPQWGGPDRNFKTAATGISDNWPANGPRCLWNRELGEGFSAIAVEDGKLYTMYRKGEQEVVISMDAATGKTLWEYNYDAPFPPEYDMSHGPGPHATPTVIGEHIYTAGATSKFNCLNKRSGKLVWSHDLIKEFNGTVRVNGYSCSPLAHKNLVYMMVGGAGNALIAFNQKDGSVVWKKHDFKNSTSSPMIINVDGQDQLVAFMFGEIVGVDPDSGNLLWSHPHPVDFGLNTSMPIWGEDNLLFISSGYNGGSRVIRLSRKEGKTVVEEIWAHRLMRVHFGNCMRVGDYIYGSSGDFGPAPFTAIDVKTGQVLWRDRTISRASFLMVGDRFILLDEDGNLAIATATREGLKVHSKVGLLKRQSWTVPTVAGTRLYVRDRKSILAVDLK